MHKRLTVFFAFAILLPLLSSRPVVVMDNPAVSTHNPLMPGTDQLYNFERFSADDIRTASTYTENKVTMLLSAIGGVADKDRTFANTMYQLDEIYNLLQKSTNLYELLVNTHTDKTIRDVSGDMLQKFSSKTDELMQNEALYNAVKAYSETADAKSLTGERAYFLTKTLRQFELNGMKLSPVLRDTLKSINNRLNELGVKFGQNISGDKTLVSVKPNEGEGLPEDMLVKARAQDPNQLQFDLSTPTYTTFMAQCKSTEARKRMYIAKMNVGGEANETILVQVLKLRSQKAKLLGFKTYSEYATADIMAKNTKTVWDFEKGLAKDLRPKAEADLKALLEIKNRMNPAATPSTVIYPYEGAFYTNELLKTKYKVDQEKVKEYFEINNVMEGIFTVYQKLYRLRFEEDKSPAVWYRDVKAFTVYDESTGERIGYFYLDLYPRADKYNHFACFPLTGSKTLSNGERQLKCAALVCNFPPSTPEKPSLLPHSTVITFFHEFGHLIHCLLSETELAALAGTNVAGDFVEAPSQMMENWAWQEKTDFRFDKHYLTGKQMPDSLFIAMFKARNVNSGISMLQQVYYGTLDFTLNDNPPPADEHEIENLSAELQNKITMYPYVNGTHFAGSFGHLIGYGSRYYGYLWSQVYAFDMYSYMQENGVLSPEAGARYREKVLSKGGSDDAINLVTDFLGREPNNQAFLRHIGL